MTFSRHDFRMLALKRGCEAYFPNLSTKEKTGDALGYSLSTCISRSRRERNCHL